LISASCSWSPSPPAKQSDQRLKWQIFREFKEREPDESNISTPIGGFDYFLKEEAGLQMPLVLRKAPGASEHLVFNPNTELQIPGAYLKTFRINRFEDSIAFSFSEKPGAPLRLAWKKIGSKDAVLGEVGALDSFEWQDLNLLAITLENLRPNKLFSLDAQSGKASLIFEELRPDHYLELKPSKDGSSILIRSHSEKCSDYMRLEKDGLKIWKSNVCEESFLGDASEKGELTYAKYPYFRDIKRTAFNSALNPSADPSLFLRAVDNFRDYSAFYLSDLSKNLIVVLSSEGKLIKTLSFPFEEQVDPLLNLNSNSDNFRFSIQSLAQPLRIMRYRPGAPDAELISEVKLKSDPLIEDLKLSTSTISASSSDGTKIPISIVFDAKNNLERPKPLLLGVYGAYGSAYRRDFDYKLLSLLQRGANFAICHVRGGGEGGESWHWQGAALKKKNSVADLLACRDELIRRGVTSEGSISLFARSAGGLTALAAINQNPAAFKSLVLEAPFTDPISYLKNLDAPHMHREIDEWGDIREPQDLAYLRSYAPLLNLKKAAYGQILIEHSVSDEIISVQESLEFHNKFRAVALNPDALELDLLDAGSHAVLSSKEKLWEEKAREFQFILNSFVN